MQEEIKSRLNLDNACYHSVQIPLTSRLISRKAKVKIHKKTKLVLNNDCASCFVWV
jgi:hypothetical protein